MTHFLTAILLSAALRGAPAEPQEEAQRSVLVGLRAEEADVARGIEGFGLLYREMFRQAVLLAAREGLGLPTRDQALREPLPEGPATLECHLQVSARRIVRFSLTQGAAGAAKTVWETQLDLPPGVPLNVAELAPLVEPLSRGPLVEALRQAGFPGKSRAAAPAEPVPAGVEERLEELTFTEPYAALRELHDACARTGESPARLGALVRAYANLGQLCRGLWNATPKVFAARSLLYAQRLVAAAPGTRTALWHRAYALTMMGLPKAALEDLAAARALGNPPETAPRWVAWIEACCTGDTPALESGGPRPVHPLQRFLGFLTVERCGCSSYERDQALRLLRENPECYRVVNALCAVGGISNLHQSTMAGPMTLGTLLYGRLKAQPGLPPRVRTAMGALQPGIPEPQVRLLVWKSLLASTEPAEPSWPLLGRLIEETTFMQIARRGDFMHNQWCVPCQAFVEEVSPLIADHPCRCLIRSYAVDPERQRKEWAALFEMLHVVDITEEFNPIASAAWNQETAHELGRQVWALMWKHLDTVVPDLEWILRITDPEKEVDTRLKVARFLQAVHPYSATAAAEFVERDWLRVEARAAELEKTCQHHPKVLHALGRRYHGLGRPQDAERCLRREIEVAPSVDAWRSLAAVYRDQKDEEKWQEALEKALTVEDVGLEHPAVRVELAEHFMKLGRFDKAEPYAAQAAESWAAWAMLCAARCYEGLGEWEKAELWQRRTSERYDNARLEWFFWCKRTGKGDVREAEALAQNYFRELEPRATPGDRELLGAVCALSDKPRQALEAFRKAFEATDNPYDGLHVALLAMGLKDEKTRDAALARVIDKGGAAQVAKGTHGLEVLLAKEFRDLLELGPGAAPNTGVFERVLSKAPDAGYRANAAYFVGRFLELQLSAAEGKPYYEQCLKTEQPQKWNYLLSKEALRKKF